MIKTIYNDNSFSSIEIVEKLNLSFAENDMSYYICMNYLTNKYKIYLKNCYTHKHTHNESLLLLSRLVFGFLAVSFSLLILNT